MYVAHGATYAVMCKMMNGALRSEASTSAARNEHRYSAKPCQSRGAIGLASPFLCFFLFEKKRKKNHDPITMKNTTSINPITQLPANGSVAFAIDDFTPTTHLIQVQWYQPGTSTNHTAELCRSCFEQWLEETGRLDYYTEPEEDNYSNLPTSGTNDTDSYWQYADYQTQTSDIKAFILAEVRAQQDLS